MAVPSFSEWSGQGGGQAAAPSFSTWAGQSSTPSFQDFVGGKTAPQTPPDFASYTASQGPGQGKLRGVFDFQGVIPEYEGFRQPFAGGDQPVAAYDEGVGPGHWEGTLGEGAQSYWVPDAPPIPEMKGSTPEVQALIESGAIKPPDQSWRDNWSVDAARQGIPREEFQVNASALPTTRYGDLSQVRPFDQPSGKAGGWTLRDPSAWYDDPNYGPVTDKRNLIDPSSERDIYDMLGPLAMSLVLGAAGMGAFGPVAAGSKTALGLVQGAQGVLRSGGASLPSFAGSVAGSLTGIPGASTVGSFLGSTLAGNKPNPISSGINAAVSFADWLAGGKK